MKRRNFITNTTLGTTALMLSALESYANPLELKTKNMVNKEFELLILATDWGFEGSRDQFFDQVKKDGYDGVELWCPGDDKGQKEMINHCEKRGLKYGFLVGSGDTNPDKNLVEFMKIIDKAVTLKPLYINCHSAKDFFSDEDLLPFFEYTIEASEKSGVPIYHETHRGRALYNSGVAKRFLNKLPDLKITGDFSHWCVVHESLLGDQEETMELALSRTDHIHARIGHAEGPQVNDPRAPEWDEAVKAHFAWWDKIVERKKEKGERVTILTEFGPADYMPTLPYTRRDVADQHGINVYMKDLLRKRYL